MRKGRRRLLIALGVTTMMFLLGVAALALWLWWPSPNKLQRYAAPGDVAGVQQCLKFGVDPNTRARWGWNHENEGQTPLTTAARFGQVQVVRLLLDKGADPNLLDSGAEFPHESPLSTAAMHGQLEVCRVLLERGADPNIPTNPKQAGDPKNWTALDWALQAKQTAIADLLRQHGALEGRRRRTK